LVVGNMETGLAHELREFKESLTVMLVGLLFVLLAADVRLEELARLGWGGIATVLALMFLVRPLAVAVSTAGSILSWKERGFIAWLGPRGIVAAAVASLFAQALNQQGVAGGSELRALVFLVIAVTVVVQGLSGALVANALGVRRPRKGFVIVGANAIGRTLARVLESGGESVALVDSNAWNVRAAEQEGLTVISGNANDESRLLRADIEARRGFLAATTNEGVNLLLARRTRERFGVPQSAVVLHRAKSGVQEQQVHENGAAVLFGSPIEIDQWNQRLQQEAATVEPWTYMGDEETTPPLGDAGDKEPVETEVLPLAVVRGGSIRPVDDDTRIRSGDSVMLALLRSQAEATRGRLRAAGWEPAMHGGHP
ncbi:MAG TPA: NAD-binding protein, partial [Longimicrobiaceae bacterium]|nr:NAD-binding protein [Longimicrobiaceae bacterium]